MRRREFLKVGAAAGAAVALPALRPSRAGAAALRLSGPGYAAKFVSPLPRPQRIDLTRTSATQQMEMVQFSQQVLQGYPKTTVWGYRPKGGNASWPGPTIISKSGVPTKIQWRNELPSGAKTFAEAHILPVDLTGHMAMPPSTLQQGNIPLVTHQHGGHTAADSDGYPDAWFTQKYSQYGESWTQAVYHYDNSQSAGTLWYHDHATGITRLNVYAGLAGMWLLRDDHELALIRDNVLPGDPYEVELCIQDRWFRDDGSLDIDVRQDPPNGRSPSIFADFMCVNGRPWPVLDVEPRPYRFRLLNASDSRALILTLSDPDARFIQVGTDLGLMATALDTDQVLMGPAERYDVVIDFSALAGREVILGNRGPDGPLRWFANASGVVTNEPHDRPVSFGPAGPNASSTGLVMKFRVSKPLSNVPKATVTPGVALGGGVPSRTADNVRQVALIQGRDSFNRIIELQGTVADGSHLWTDPATETPVLGATEVWEIHNASTLAHPIHVHLVDFEVLDRQPFTFTQTPKTHDMMGTTVTGGTLSDVTLSGPARGPLATERGPKDVVLCYPGEVTRVIARFDKPGDYVWHCHILHHEDHDMMRPIRVGAPDGSTAFVRDDTLVCRLPAEVRT